MGHLAPGEGVPRLIGVRTVVSKDNDTSNFNSIGYYNGTEGLGGVKGIIERFETILDSKNHGSPGLGGLKAKNTNLVLDKFGENTHFSPVKWRRIAQCNTGKELDGGILTGSQRISRRRRLAGGTATPPRLPTGPTRSTGEWPGGGRMGLA
jgi:hypothetical protein